MKKGSCNTSKALPEATPAKTAAARSALHRLAVCWGSVDLADIELLTVIDDHPGINIKTAAELTGLDQRTAQLKIALLSTGRRQGRSSARRFVTNERKPYDRRERVLELTPAGAEFLEDLRGAL